MSTNIAMKILLCVIVSSLLKKTIYVCYPGLKARSSPAVSGYITILIVEVSQICILNLGTKLFWLSLYISCIRTLKIYMLLLFSVICQLSVVMEVYFLLDTFHISLWFFFIFLIKFIVKFDVWVVPNQYD